MIARVARSPWTHRALIFVALALVWQVWALSAHSLLIPTFTATVVALAKLATVERLWSALAVSNQAMVIGYVISLVIAIPAGIAMGRFRWFEKVTAGYLGILLVLPTAPFIPLVITAFGLELTARVVLIVLFSSVIVTVTCRAGARQVDPSLIEMARSFGASERQTWMKVLIPACLPGIMAGARIGLARSVEGMVLVELLLASVGVGGLILEFEGFFKPDYLYAVVVVIIIESLALSAIARRLEVRLSPWALRGGLRQVTR
jgi:NitT/TauT family transport system permease protein